MSAMILGAMSVMGVFSANVERQRTLSVRYFTTLSQQRLTFITLLMTICFQQDSALADHACNTARLQGSELSTLLLLIMAFNTVPVNVSHDLQ